MFHVGRAIFVQQRRTPKGRNRDLNSQNVMQTEKIAGSDKKGSRVPKYQPTWMNPTISGHHPYAVLGNPRFEIKARRGR